ncbi:MAG: DegV family protein [Oscillospiraceae bacterium]|nr:DegV family protein [Oscillospiraceae bacterium]
MKIKITSDSTCDLSPVQLQENDISILGLVVNKGGKAFTDGVDIQPDDIYAHVAAGGDLCSTAALNPSDYMEFFSHFAEDYDAIIHVNISTGFSSCHQNACLAAAEMENVYVIDSLNLSTGHGLVVLEAVKLAREGKTPEEIVACLNAMRDKVRASFVLEQLEYMKKGGRCSAVTVLGANLLKLKPCIEVKDGKMGVATKYRGSMEKCLKDYITDRLQNMENIRDDLIFITHSGMDQALIDLAVAEVEAKGYFKNIVVTRAGCTVSCHCGPGTLGILFVEK